MEVVGNFFRSLQNEAGQKREMGRGSGEQTQFTLEVYDTGKVL